jgi:hypothetical protein
VLWLHVQEFDGKNKMLEIDRKDLEQWKWSHFFKKINDINRREWVYEETIEEMLGRERERMIFIFLEVI